MENRQGRKGKPDGNAKARAAAAAADRRQMDLWTGGERAADAPQPPPKNVVQLPEAPAKSAVSRTRAKPAARPAVQVTVSKPSRLQATSSARSLPALTRRQHELLDYLRRRAMQPGPPPSLNEICRDVGLASRGSLHKQVVALVHAGLVEPMQGKQRGVRLVAGGAANDEVPMLGAIAAGRPIEALSRDEGVALPDWLRSGSCYALRVRGDSMRDVGILDGDVVVVEPRGHARNGETVVALIDGESATLKRIEQRADGVLLHAENPAYAPQHYAADRVQIQGVVIAQLRRY